MGLFGANTQNRVCKLRVCSLVEVAHVIKGMLGHSSNRICPRTLVDKYMSTYSILNVLNACTQSLCSPPTNLSALNQQAGN